MVNHRAWTYLLYILCFEFIVIGGCGYAVFVLDANPWWFALAILMSFCAYKPAQWIDGKSRNET